MSLLIQKSKSIGMVHKMESTGEIIIQDSDYQTISIIGAIAPTKDDTQITTYDPVKSRKYFWEKIFGLEPLPSTVSNAADLFAGSLGRDLDITSTDLQTALDDADEN